MYTNTPHIPAHIHPLFSTLREPQGLKRCALADQPFNGWYGFMNLYAFPDIEFMLFGFRPVDALLFQIESDAVQFIAGTPVLIDYDQELSAIAPAMQGWCDSLSNIARRVGISLDLSPLNRIANKLSYGIAIEPGDLKKAKSLVNRCKSAFMACTNIQRVSATNDVLIGIEIERLGFT